MLQVAVLFVYPRYNTYKYLTGDYKVTVDAVLPLPCQHE
jgi:hypothetical protein